MSREALSPDVPVTEGRDPRSASLDRMEALDAVALFQAADLEAVRALEAAAPAIAAAVELVAARLAAGGRLLYVGAGTSGRLGVLDAAECPPTFGTAPERVQGVIAGGPAALTRAVEGAEDDPAGGAAAMDERSVDERDVVFGIAASGRTPFVRGALERARERGASTVLLCCVPEGPGLSPADVTIHAVTGPELIAGSTRLKAATATKLVLNRVSTLAMVRLGKTHGNLMVDVEARTNTKLTSRALALIEDLAGVERREAERLLDAAGGSVKLAVVMHARGVDAANARELLEASGGFLRGALGEDGA